MEGILQTTLLTSAIFLSSFLPQATSSAALSPLPVIGQESYYVVKEEDTLKNISKEVYGKEENVELILKDNEFILNPDYIEIGWNLKIRKNPLLLESSFKNTTDSDSETEKEYISLIPTYPVNITPQVQSSSLIATITPKVTSAPQVETPVYSGGPLNQFQIQYLGNCEAGMDPAKNTGNGYYGAFQFSYQTWQSMGTGYERADLAPIEVQIDAVQRLLSRSSIYTQFPGCARKMQSIGLI